MLRDEAADESGTVATEDEDAIAVGGTMEAMPAALLSPMVRLLTGPRADCADTKLTDDEGATGLPWDMGAAVEEEAGGTEEGVG